jgi:hypothetical protein
MKLLIGDIIQYEYDDWSYIVRDVDTTRKNGEIHYECISPEGGDNTMVWTHTVKGVLDYITKGKISVIKRLIKPINTFPKLKF